MTKEWDPREPGAHQLKYFAPGAGNVRVGFAGAKEKEKETLVLGSLRDLGASAMTKIRRQVLESSAGPTGLRRISTGKPAPAKPME